MTMGRINNILTSLSINSTSRLYVSRKRSKFKDTPTVVMTAPGSREAKAKGGFFMWLILGTCTVKHFILLPIFVSISFVVLPMRRALPSHRSWSFGYCYHFRRSPTHYNPHLCFCYKGEWELKISSFTSSVPMRPWPIHPSSVLAKQEPLLKTPQVLLLVQSVSTQMSQIRNKTNPRNRIWPRPSMSPKLIRNT